MDKKVTDWSKAIQNIAQTGANYCKDHYCHERYVELLKIAAQMMAENANIDPEALHELFIGEISYPTPKIDVRGVVIKDDKILMVQESEDQLWSLPGGWVDAGESPGVAIVREVREETGYEVRATKLLALYDKLKHDHPPQWPHALKTFILCEFIGGTPTTSHEISAVDFFAEDKLPPLSLHRVIESQIKRMFEHARHPDWPTDFD